MINLFPKTVILFPTVVSIHSINIPNASAIAIDADIFYKDAKALGSTLHETIYKVSKDLVKIFL